MRFLKLVILILCSLCMTDVYGRADMDTVSSQGDRYFLYYYRDRVDLQEDYLDNERQMARIKKVMSLSPRIDSIVVYAYSSPEGTPRRNNFLARERAEVARQFILANLPNDSVLLPENIILRPMGENWDGLKQELQSNYHLMNRDRVLKILDADINTETKKWRLQNLDNGFTWKWIIQHHMPQLRIATWVCVFVPTPELSADSTFADNQHLETIQPQDSVVPADTIDAMKLFPATKHHTFPVFALKTNMLYDAALVPNLGVEFYLGKQWSIATNWHYAWWNNNTWFWRTYGGELDVRKWLGSAAKERPLTGHHLGIYGQVLAYDFMIGDHGFMSGNAGEHAFIKPSYAFGLEYGYSLPIAKRLNIDFVLGLGYQGGVYNEYYLMDDHYVWHATKKRHFIGPTKAEISLVWLLGPVNKKGGSK